MNDDIWKRDEVQSPCVKLCQIHPTEQLCIGCFRTLREIGGWSQMSADERRAVIEQLPARAPRLQKRRGGRARNRPGNA
ncbi:hypothetical protein BFP70_15565 [Thioclava sp. SK-1]|uniref:DUF1289 domain-containing protein n=1 Tax=Thioclava sp. SK-1 TaxID=1889770 RepID=UPI0008258267|nr:DUF1289 domain-containing protein [Thioclava sp. SK-1]OCX61438.1 hypothetical protein BFP70_15565 [Thioclava sp. SK-1]